MQVHSRYHTHSLSHDENHKHKQGSNREEKRQQYLSTLVPLCQTTDLSDCPSPLERLPGVAACGASGHLPPAATGPLRPTVAAARIQNTRWDSNPQSQNCKPRHKVGLEPTISQNCKTMTQGGTRTHNLTTEKPRHKSTISEQKNQCLNDGPARACPGLFCYVLSPRFQSSKTTLWAI